MATQEAPALDKPFSIFEFETCPRCGGSGRYSYNMMDGDRCYGCGGRGQRLTKRGAEAHRVYDALLTRQVGEELIGKALRMDDYSFDGRSSRVSWKVLRAIRPDPLNPGMLVLDLTDRRTGQASGCHVWSNMTFRVLPTPEENAVAKAIALDYQSKLGKNGKPLAKHMYGPKEA